MCQIHSSPICFGWAQLKQQIPADSAALVDLNWDRTLEPQSYEISVSSGRVRVCAGDDAGMMYALLDLADLYTDGWPEELKISQKPYLTRRGIKFNLPLDARTPSYSDASSSAFESIPDVWDFDFWREYLDFMAAHKFNVLSLWNLSPFPSLVRIPEYPLTALEDVVRSTIPPRPEMSGKEMWSADMAEGAYPVKKMTMDEKISFWRRVMQYAHDRCIDVYLFTWNLFVYGTEGNPYGITCDQHNPVTADYLRCAVRALLDTYPLLAGIGITSGENMAGDETDIPFLRNTYAAAIEDYCTHHPQRRVELIHRMQYARYPQIREEYRNFSGDFSVSFKYSQAHLHSYAQPSFFSDFLSTYPGNEQFWLTLRDDDYYLFRWYDYDFAQDFFRQMPADRIRGFYLGADGFTWGRDYTGRSEDHPLYLEKMWAKLSLFGALAYNPQVPQKHFLRQMHRKLACSDASLLAQLWSRVSAGFRTLQAVHWNDYDFQWYPEGCCQFLHPPIGKLVFTDINEFMNRPAMPGTPFQSVRDYCENGMQGTQEHPRTPMEAVQALRLIVQDTQALLTSPNLRGNQELDATLADIYALHLLNLYYADKLEAAIYLCCYRLDRKQVQCQQRAVYLLTRASDTWKQYSAFSREHYLPQRLTRMGGNMVDFTAFDRSAEADIELALYQ